MKALILAADRVEDLELFYPYYRLKEQGFAVDIATPGGQTIRGKHGYEIDGQQNLSKVRSQDYDLLILPGGKAPETVRLDSNAVRVTQEMMEAGKVVAAVCHGAQTLISAGVLQGRSATCWQAIRDDVKAAGAEYHDEEVVVDGNLITSRCPDDLPAFMHSVLTSLELRSVQPADAAVGAPQRP